MCGGGGLPATSDRGPVLANAGSGVVVWTPLHPPSGRDPRALKTVKIGPKKGRIFPVFSAPAVHRPGGVGGLRPLPSSYCAISAAARETLAAPGPAAAAVRPPPQRAPRPRPPPSREPPRAPFAAPVPKGETTLASPCGSSGAAPRGVAWPGSAFRREPPCLRPAVGRPPPMLPPIACSCGVAP